MALELWNDRFAGLRRRLGADHGQGGSSTFKVPSYLRESCPSNYNPKTVSFGLNSRVETWIENYKADWQRIFLKWKSSRSAPEGHAHNDELVNNGDSIANSGARPMVPYTWDQFIDDLTLDSDVKDAHSWYKIDNIPAEVVSNFLALDALFLMLFLRHSCRSSLPNDVYEDIGKEGTYQVLARAHSGIWRDIFLLENQIPLRILIKVFKLMPDMVGKGDDIINNSLNELLLEVMKNRYLELFENTSDKGENIKTYLSGTNFLGCDHLLDCFHYILTYSPKETADGPPYTIDVPAVDPRQVERALVRTHARIPSATSLRGVGVKITSEGCHFIHQVKLISSAGRSPVLRLPRLCITENTESLLRNVAVFEIMTWDQPSRIKSQSTIAITPFLLLMDKLLQNTEDVGLLETSGVITSCLVGNSQMCEMWSRLCFRMISQVPIVHGQQQTNWGAIMQKLTDRYSKSRHRWFAEFKRTYIAQPWVVVHGLWCQR